jgi:hypothetical protein
MAWRLMLYLYPEVLQSGVIIWNSRGTKYADKLALLTHWSDARQEGQLLVSLRWALEKKLYWQNRQVPVFLASFAT